MAHELPALPYPNNALEPAIDAKTMEIHHDKHHQAYVTNLNKALESAPDLAGKSADEQCSDDGESLRGEAWHHVRTLGSPECLSTKGG